MDEFDKKDQIKMEAWNAKDIFQNNIRCQPNITNMSNWNIFSIWKPNCPITCRSYMGEK